MKHNLSIIDADSIIYLVASRFKDVRVKSIALNALDDFIMDILKVTYAKEYFGFFGKMGGAKNFRYDVAKTKPYKGNRGDKADWYLYWEKIMKKHMENVWHFTPVEYVEADDMCTFYGTLYKGNPKYGKIIVCSPDKDLKQLGGIWHYDYWKRSSEYISETKGEQNLYRQCIEGDGTDNVQGLLGCGKTVAKAHVHQFNDANISKLPEATKQFFKTYLHETLPAKQLKSAEKVYLANHKLSFNISRYTKQTKAAALQLFRMGGQAFKPKDDDYYISQFDEMYELVYMLRTIEEINVFWKEYKVIIPVVEEYMDWGIIDSEKELLDAPIIEEDFTDTFDFLDDEFEDL